MLDFLKRKKPELPKRDIMDEYERLAKLEVLEKLPAGTVIRAVKPKTTGYKWAAQFNSTNGLRRGQTYYGATVHEAVREMLAHDELAAEKFYANNGTLAGTTVDE